MKQTSLNAVMSSEVMDWCTPLNVLEPIYKFAPVALDPCSNCNSIVEAKLHLNNVETVSGLEADWMVLSEGGLIFVNPPYGPALKQWMAKCFEEAVFGCEIIALVPARTDTKWWHSATALLKDPTYPARTAICFWKGRIKFLGGKHCAPFPSALIYYGNRMSEFVTIFDEYGLVVL